MDPCAASFLCFLATAMAFTFIIIYIIVLQVNNSVY